MSASGQNGTKIPVLACMPMSLENGLRCLVKVKLCGVFSFKGHLICFVWQILDFCLDPINMLFYLQMPNTREHFKCFKTTPLAMTSSNTNADKRTLNSHDSMSFEAQFSLVHVTKVGTLETMVKSQKSTQTMCSTIAFACEQRV